MLSDFNIQTASYFVEPFKVEIRLSLADRPDSRIFDPPSLQSGSTRQRCPLASASVGTFADLFRKPLGPVVKPPKPKAKNVEYGCSTIAFMLTPPTLTNKSNNTQNHHNCC
jgi:hypothetical protein